MKNKVLFFGVAALTFAPRLVSAGPQCDGVSAISGNAGCNANALETAITEITKTLFYIIGAISVIFLLIGAIRYITSTGDATRIKQAKDTIFYAIAGVVIAIVAQAIIAFVITRV